MILQNKLSRIWKIRENSENYTLKIKRLYGITCSKHVHVHVHVKKLSHITCTCTKLSHTHVLHVHVQNYHILHVHVHVHVHALYMYYVPPDCLVASILPFILAVRLLALAFISLMIASGLLWSGLVNTISSLLSVFLALTRVSIN